MSILNLLRGRAETPDSPGDTKTVRRIVGELDALDGDRARFIAAFAYILGRVAHADLRIEESERLAMERIVTEIGELSAEQAILVVQIAKSHNELLGGTENFLVTREFRDLSTVEERRHLLECLFAVSAADGSVSTQEENHIRQVASELGLDHKTYIEIRSRYSAHREVLKPLGGNE